MVVWRVMSFDSFSMVNVFILNVLFAASAAIRTFITSMRRLSQVKTIVEESTYMEYIPIFLLNARLLHRPVWRRRRGFLQQHPHAEQDNAEDCGTVRPDSSAGEVAAERRTAGF